MTDCPYTDVMMHKMADPHTDLIYFIYLLLVYKQICKPSAFHCQGIFYRCCFIPSLSDILLATIQKLPTLQDNNIKTTAFKIGILIYTYSVYHKEVRIVILVSDNYLKTVNSKHSKPSMLRDHLQNKFPAKIGRF